MSGLRERNRRNTLVLTQRAGIELFGERGFDAVKVAEIAEAVGIAPSTLYRHYPTKESIVLWDEHEQAFEQALERELGQHPPFEALRAACLAAVADRYDADAEFQLLRVGLIYETPSIYAAAAAIDRRERDELAAFLQPHLSRKQRHAAPLLAAAALMALDRAFEQWQACGAKKPLKTFVAGSFEVLGHLADLG